MCLKIFMCLCGLINNIIQTKVIEGIQYIIYEFTSYGIMGFYVLMSWCYIISNNNKKPYICIMVLCSWMSLDKYIQLHIHYILICFMILCHYSPQILTQTLYSQNKNSGFVLSQFIAWISNVNSCLCQQINISLNS